MKKIDIGQTITTLANVGVIAGILFLTFEIRQNTAQMRAEAAFSIHQDIQRLNESEYSDRALTELLIKADEQYESLEEADRARVNAFYFSEIDLADFVMGLHEEGLSDLIFQTEEIILNKFRASPGRRAFIDSVYRPMSAEGAYLRPEELHRRLVGGPTTVPEDASGRVKCLRPHCHNTSKTGPSVRP